MRPSSRAPPTGSTPTTSKPAASVAAERPPSPRSAGGLDRAERTERRRRRHRAFIRRSRAVPKLRDMPGWNFADVWETVADVLPEATAQVQGDRRLTWSQFDRRADGIARTLLDLGVER